MAKLTLETFKNFFKYYNEEEHQIRAIEELYSGLEGNVCAVYLDDQSDWVLKYRNKVKQPTESIPEKQWPITKNQMAQVTYRGVQYDTNRTRKDTNVNADKTQLVYRGIKLNKEV